MKQDDSWLPAYATTAAKWWGDKLRTPQVQDTGDDELSMKLTFMGITRKRAYTDEQIAVFERALMLLIISEHVDHLKMDYDPDPTLMAAGWIAGIDVKFYLPVKTTMLISMDTLMVSEGKGGDQRVAWTREKETA